MNVSEAIHQRTPVPVALGVAAAAGLVLAEAATYWDDAWHTDKGRDDFAIPPHLLLYGGVLVASLAIAAWGMLSWRAAGWRLSGLRVVFGDPAIRLAAIGGVVTLASAPLDNWWHTEFGRDAVLWSPPHLTAVAGTLALVVGLSAGLRDTTGPGARAARLVVGAGIIGALQVLVLEYDSDVPQFSTVWFLPVATLALCIAVALMEDLLPGRWAPSVAGLIYTILRAGTVAMLALLGFSLTVIPPVFLLLLVLGTVSFLPLATRLVLLGILSPLAWWPILQLQSDVTTTVPASELPVAIVLGVAGALLVSLVHGDLRRGPITTADVRTAMVLGMLALAVVVAPEKASAHDPGQGDLVKDVRLTVARDAGSAELTLTVPGGCESVEPVRIAARRAGETRSGALRIAAGNGSGSGCVVRGTVTGLTSGRWFVYAELKSADGEALEVWLPVGENETATASRALYNPPPADAAARSQVLVGAGLLGVIAGILVACLRLARQVSRQNDGWECPVILAS